MYADRGIGLAANQVDLPYRLFVMNLTADPREKSEELLLLNPVIVRRSGMAEAEEGCLSLPGIFAPVRRPEKVVVSAYSLAGEELSYELSGLAARAVQHEADHLDGVLFIDRLATSHKLSIKDELADLEAEFDGGRRRGEIPADERIASRLAELESLRT